jgi:hypothetical protein
MADSLAERTQTVLSSAEPSALGLDPNQLERLYAMELAEASLAWAQQNLRPEFRGPDKAFGVEVAVSDDAPAYDRLVGFFGREPGYAAR